MRVGDSRWCGATEKVWEVERAEAVRYAASWWKKVTAAVMSHILQIRDRTTLWMLWYDHVERLFDLHARWRHAKSTPTSWIFMCFIPNTEICRREDGTSVRFESVLIGCERPALFTRFGVGGPHIHMFMIDTVIYEILNKIPKDLSYRPHSTNINVKNSTPCTNRPSTAASSSGLAAT